ncbi:MAG: hypothetical protein IPM96_22060 [Ignavibacteria bacterium]|nr:hypothetical protein [Ignavibacteria bacterium]
MEKRSDYQCEPVLSNDDLWFYSFNVSKQSTYIQNIVDTTYGNGAIVKGVKEIRQMLPAEPTQS